MPKQKDLKRVVRARMQKTGESYTAARLHVIKTKTAPADYAKLAGMSDDAVKKQTGRDWAAWVRTLDAIGGTSKSHRETVAYVSSIGTPSWWSQMVVVGYERIRGLRDRGQRRGGGYEVNKSRTFAVPVERLYDAVANERTRARWLTEANVSVRSAKPNKTMRLKWDDDTAVQFTFTSKGEARSQLVVVHQKLRDKSAAEKMKAFWAGRLEALSAVLA